MKRTLLFAFATVLAAQSSFAITPVSAPAPKHVTNTEVYSLFDKLRGQMEEIVNGKNKSVNEKKLATIKDEMSKLSHQQKIDLLAALLTETHALDRNSELAANMAKRASVVASVFGVAYVGVDVLATNPTKTAALEPILENSKLIKEKKDVAEVRKRLDALKVSLENTRNGVINTPVSQKL